MLFVMLGWVRSAALLLSPLSFRSPSLTSSSYCRKNTWIPGDKSNSSRWTRTANAISVDFGRSDGFSVRRPVPIKMIVDPWSVSSETADVLAGQFFSLSLLPYLGFLYYLSRPETDCPPLANAGFRFLLVFVLCSIPAGIYSKIHYHDILANVDWLHGSAESLLTVTNLLIVLGMRSAVNGRKTSDTDKSKKTMKTAPKLNSIAIVPLIAALTSFLGLTLPVHTEPSNALSFPTWIIHVSSVIEWLVAMSLVYDYAEVSRNPRWKILTWAMIPLHTSGLCACTYHFFYNAPSMNVLVTLQAFLTLLGNTGMLAAVYAIYRHATRGVQVEKGSFTKRSSGGMVGFEDLAIAARSDVSAVFMGKIMALSAAGAALVKWGELLLDVPFNPSFAVALAMIFLPTGLNVLKWLSLSQQE